MSLSALAARILHFMETPPPPERIFRRRELAHLGPPAEVDRALAELERTNRAGRPAPDIWMPLEPWRDRHGIVRYAPPAYLRHLGESLLQREGAVLTESRAERNYRQSWEAELAQAGGAEAEHAGMWGVPTFADIGVTTPVSLRLRWGQAHIRTEYKDRKMASPPQVCTAFEILDRDGFVAEASRQGLSPARLEKDIHLNRVLQALGRMAPPHGQLILHGGACLAKAWELVPRFSNDIDCNLQLPPDQPSAAVAIKQAVRAYVHDYLTQHFLPTLPGGHLFARGSKFRPRADVQTLIFNYDSQFAPDPRLQTGVKLEIAFGQPRVPVTAQKVHNALNPLQAAPEVITTMPCMVPWAILAGKVSGLVHRIPRWADVAEHLRPPAFVRHVVDLYLCRIVFSVHPDTVRQMRVLIPRSDRDLDTRLRQTCTCLRADPFYARAYRDFLDEMFLPGNLPNLTWDQAVDNLEALGDRLLERAPPETDCPDWTDGAW